MVRVFFAWWLRQLLELLPASWRRAGPAHDGGDAVLIAPTEPPPGGKGGLDVALRRRGRDRQLGRFLTDQSGLAALRAALGTTRHGPVRLLLPPRLLLEQSVTLPLAAERELEAVLRWEMDRLTPFPADAVFWTWQITRRDRPHDRLLLRLRLVPKAAVAWMLEALAGAGLQPATLEAAADPARAIPLTGGSAGRHRRGVAAVGAALAGLLLAALAVPLVRQQLAFDRIDARIAALRPQVELANALRKRLHDRAASDGIVVAEGARVGDTLRMLAAITDVLPDDTFLTELALRDRVLTITGQSAAAARLIPALAADAAIRNPVFAAPVTRNESTGAEAFSIRAEMRP